jgi:Fe-S-cluster containining protein
MPAPPDPPFDCRTCGACCREAYHAVEVHPREKFVRTHAEWLVRVDGRWNVRREGHRCAALGGCDGAWTCVVYAARPETCREFEVGSDNCLEARRRVGLT